MGDFEAFASERLVEELGEEVCRKADLPLLFRLAVANCQQQIREQRDPLAALVRKHSRRVNLGLVSLFRSEVGGQRLLGWQVPKVHSLVLGVAGQFLLLHAGHDQSGEAMVPAQLSLLGGLQR